MAPSLRDLQLTRVAGAGEDDDAGDLEDVRLLDSYEDGERFSRIEEGMRRVQVSISGMTCAACSNSVEAALKSVNGVHLWPCFRTRLMWFLIKAWLRLVLAWNSHIV
ncbi:hypothetical protein FH972_007683 [Carpinus fangiana]|uniref:HMA domain-containing protein n=1 Tax=Carpinus fangiana TaxID=176857 RepID=A0A5N6QX81_9ROSI|nr:hypothetical protein FH972_007683 [Carpinus fangiana]